MIILVVVVIIDVHWKLVPCTWTSDKECTINKLRAHLANTKVAVCRSPKIRVYPAGFSTSRTAQIGEVWRYHEVI